MPEVYDKLLLKCEWERMHSLGFLWRKDTEELPEAVKDLLKMRKKNENLYRKLVASIKLQLEERDIVANKNRVRPWKSDNVGRNQIYEFKSSAGLGFRLFFFIHEEEVVICTHGWEKDNEKSKTKQDQQFSRAEKYRFLFEQ